MNNSIVISENQFSSIWWRKGLFFILYVEFVVLIWVTTVSYYRDSQHPIPEKVIDNTGLVVFTGIDIQAGQEVFLQNGLMNNGSIWGHGAYLGPDFSAQYSAWASVANSPANNYSYTNNFPYEPLIGNGPSSATILWSALSLITLLAGTALNLLFFEKSTERDH